MMNITTETEVKNPLSHETGRAGGETSNNHYHDAGLPSGAQLQKLLAKLDDNLLASFVRETLPEIVDAVRENQLSKLHEILGDWIATFEEYAAAGAVDKILQSDRNIEEGKAMPWKDVQELLKN